MHNPNALAMLIVINVKC